MHTQTRTPRNIGTCVHMYPATDTHTHIHSHGHIHLEVEMHTQAHTDALRRPGDRAGHLQDSHEAAANRRPVQMRQGLIPHTHGRRDSETGPRAQQQDGLDMRRSSHPTAVTDLSQPARGTSKPATGAGVTPRRPGLPLQDPFT